MNKDEMYIDKLIKRELLTLIVSVSVLILIFVGVSFSMFFSIDKGEDNTINVGDLKITFCNDSSCNNQYANFGQVIGTKTIDGVTTPNAIYPYATDEEATSTLPYIFNIKNSGSLDNYLTIRIVEDKDFNANNTSLTSTTLLYSDYIKVGINDCTKGIDNTNVSVYRYSELNDNILLEKDSLLSNEEKTYCLWTYLSSDTPNEVQNTYFVANLDFSAEYIPSDN